MVIVKFMNARFFTIAKSLENLVCHFFISLIFVIKIDKYFICFFLILSIFISKYENIKQYFILYHFYTNKYNCHNLYIFYCKQYIVFFLQDKTLKRIKSFSSKIGD